jgi:hypothetical protein
VSEDDRDPRLGSTRSRRAALQRAGNDRAGDVLDSRALVLLLAT